MVTPVEVRDTGIYIRWRESNPEADAEELRTMIRYANEQGLSTEQFDPEELFVRADQNLL